MSFYQHTLANGLEIIGETLPLAQSVALGFFVQSGSRWEESSISGVSHFLEHMVFKGSETRSAQDVNREFDAIGASFNGCTSEECTVFYATLLPEFQEKCLEIFADILRPALRKEDFDAEKQVILEEIEMYEDAPPFRMDEKIRQAFFGDHPLGNLVLGEPASVENLSLARMKEYFEKRYVPQNMLLCVCGKFDFDEVCAQAERFCGGWSSDSAQENTSATTIIKKTLPQAQFTPKLGFFPIRKPHSAQQYILQLSRADGSTARKRLAGRLIDSILGDSSSSRLYWRLVDSGLAEQATLSFNEFSDAAYFSAGISCDPSVAKRVLEEAEEIFQNAQKGEIRQEELALAQNRVATHYILGYERASERMFDLGWSWLARHEYISIQEETTMLRSITLEEIHSFLRANPILPALVFSVGPAKIA
ncbi:MAG: pitrilysin family protein [Planctomycetia bacterium]|nr:pitrilysin family protein [Planctomycetia bacterium]